MTAFKLIDTSVWIHALGSRPVASVRDLVADIVEKHEVAICPPIAFELLRGIPDAKAFEELQEYLVNLEGLPIDWLNAAKWASSPAIRALKVKSMDLIIAHTALVHGVKLIHADDDFDRLSRKVPLKVESLVSMVRSSGASGVRA